MSLTKGSIVRTTINRNWESSSIINRQTKMRIDFSIFRKCILSIRGRCSFWMERFFTDEVPQPSNYPGVLAQKTGT